MTRWSCFALLIAALASNGCMVGSAIVEAPPRSPAALPRLTRPISFDVCVSRDATPFSRLETKRERLGEQVRSALARAGVPAQFRSSAEQPVDLTLNVDQSWNGSTWALVLSALTWSIIPGYIVERTTLDVDLALADAADGRTTEHLQYRSRKTLLIWLPLIVHLDFMMSSGGGWESERSKDAGFDQMVERLGDDLGARLGRDGETPPTSKGNHCVEPPSFRTGRKSAAVAALEHAGRTGKNAEHGPSKGRAGRAGASGLGGAVAGHAGARRARTEILRGQAAGDSGWAPFRWTCRR